MTTTPRPQHPTRRRTGLLAAALVAGSSVLAACSGSATSTAPPTREPGNVTKTTSDPTAPKVLPVKENPISNTSTAQTLKVDSVLVENNVAPGGKAADDHLEIALSNTGPSPLSGVEIFYTFADPKTKATESYYAKLPDSFTIPAAGKRTAHFDQTGAPDHLPVNAFSLYYTDTNALDVTVVASASGAAPQTATVKKDAGGPETAD